MPLSGSRTYTYSPVVVAKRQSLNYNTPGGKLNRGLSVVDTYQILVGKPLEDEIYMKASILGWAVELVRPSDALFLTFSCKLIFLSRMI